MNNKTYKISKYGARFVNVASAPLSARYHWGDIHSGYGVARGEGPVLLKEKT